MSSLSPSFPEFSVFSRGASPAPDPTPATRGDRPSRAQRVINAAKRKFNQIFGQRDRVHPTTSNPFNAAGASRTNPLYRSADSLNHADEGTLEPLNDETGYLGLNPEEDTHSVTSYCSIGQSEEPPYLEVSAVPIPPQIPPRQQTPLPNDTNSHWYQRFANTYVALSTDGPPAPQYEDVGPGAPIVPYTPPTRGQATRDPSLYGMVKTPEEDPIYDLANHREPEDPIYDLANSDGRRGSVYHNIQTSPEDDSGHGSTTPPTPSNASHPGEELRLFDEP